LQTAIPAGIGMFLALIALGNAGIVVKSEATNITLGTLRQPETVLAILGFFLIAGLDYLKIRGAILLGILAVTIASMVLGLTHYAGLVSTPPSMVPTFFQMDIASAAGMGLFNVVVVFVLVEVFDATGTLTGVARKAGLIHRTVAAVDGKPADDLKGMNRALVADSASILCGAVLGTSSTTAYIESMAGIQAGGRTGLTAFTIGVLFLLALFFTPLIGVVPKYATAPALVYVAALMLAELSHVKWDDITEAVPAALTALVMPFTYSIANGLAFGFISYVTLKLVTGRYKEVAPAAWVIALLFFARYAFFVQE
jgi:AGZA family xanthine/uracil permease-like MFS transporter